MNITKKKKLLTKEFFNILSQMNPLFEKTINKTKEDWNEREENDFEELLSYYKNIRGTSLKDMAEAYELIVNMMREETYFFRRNGRYRNSTLKDVEECVYKNEDYMTKYMLGLAISDYLWIQHIKMVRFYESHMNMFTGNYLEIGPGHGQYLARSIQKGHFSKIEAIDISPVSVDSSNEYLRYKNLSDKCQVKNMDFFEYDSVDTKFDTIVMSEVLEHVENPLNMLLKIKNLLSPNLCVGGGKAYVSTVINAPAVDHIYLFRSIEDVLSLVYESGLSVAEYACYTEQDVEIERAIKNKMAINIAMILE